MAELKATAKQLFPTANRLVLRQVRRCYSLHTCLLCAGSITLGQDYYDGGIDNRAHKDCVLQVLREVR